MADLDSVFAAFCGVGKSDMDGKGFAKMAKDCGLLDKKFTPTDVDLLFAKVVPKGQRRIDVQQFEDALGLVAQKKGVDAAELIQSVAASRGPVLSGTKTDAVRFHDDKSTYTGVHVNGGPDAVAKGDGRVPNSQTFLRPDAAPEAATAGSPRPRQAVSPRPRSPGTGSGSAPAARGASPRPASPRPAGTVQAAFSSYAGQQGMDGKTFAKVCKDCRLLDKAFTATDADLVFAKVVTKGGRRIDLGQFETALTHVASKKGTDVDTVRQAVAGSGGPVLSGTQADAVRFHDDKSTFTGVHANGGPEAVSLGAGTATQLAAAGMRLAQ